ncbi:hypothetical protein PYCCODRAFT_1478676 [Trametes coccinea BRFM310]|uniref:Uncharacterized protein n=1 Tax=Trametes coccinea (strain BRFM310) TaxID=1353009 RepID=A0A1Y2IJ68_TRAC3|nr:hypothetical protein PYCCODRAFT_1478676 [Trametes coccinea BRFM310]
MPRPLLFRYSSASTPQYDNVRAGIDVYVRDSIVGPDSGGVSVFSHKPPTWADVDTWVLPTSAPLIPGLRVLNTHGSHWIIAPSEEMSLDQFKSHLSVLNLQSSRCSDIIASGRLQPADHPPALQTESCHYLREVRFLYPGLVFIAQSRVPIPSWNNNDYEYVATLAQSLENNSVDVISLIWDPADPQDGWTRDRVFTAHAVITYIEWEQVRAQESGDEDIEADVMNDNGYLRAVFKLRVDGNPVLIASPRLSQLLYRKGP